MTQYLITALIDFYVAFLAFGKRKNKAAYALSAAAFCLGVWSIELFLLTVVTNLATLEIWFHITRVGMFFIPPTLALLAWHLVGANSRFFLLAIIYPGFIVSFCVSFANLFLFPSTLKTATGGYLPEADLIYAVFAVTFVCCLLSSMLLCAISYKSGTMRQKQRIRWLLITLTMTFAAGFASILLMPYDFYLSKYVGAGANITFVSLLFYSTVQHHLMDFKLALSEGLTRIVVLSVLLTLFLSIASAVRFDEQNIQSVVAMSVVLILMLELYPRVLKRALPNARKLIDRRGYNPQEARQDIANFLHDVVNYEQLRRACDFVFYQVLRLEGYTLISFDEMEKRSSSEIILLKQLVSIYGKEDGVIFVDESSDTVREVFSDYGAASCLSLRLNNECIGFLMLGKTNNNSYYRYDDIRLLEWLQVEISLVVSRIVQLEEMQEQLGQAKKTLSMLGVMNHYHHDIKAPLSIIDGVLSNDIYDKEKQKNIVLQQVERGSRLITTMAEILKGERRRKIQEVSLEEVARDSVYLFEQRIDGVEFEFAPIPKINADPEDLKILVINIVKNAIEARDGERPLTMKISTGMNENHISLTLWDSGKGMSADRIEALWENATSNKLQGNGIGLQAIKRIADEHSAEIQVSSVVGLGTAFIFNFPLSIAVNNELESKAGVVDLSVKRNKPLTG